MDELVKQTQPILQKLGDFFDLFDLSFIVSGMATSLSLLFVYHNLTDEEVFKAIGEWNGFLIFLSLIVVYLIGLLSWVLGKGIRNIIRKTRYSDLKNHFENNNAGNDPLYLQYANQNNQEVAMYNLYCMLWGKIRENDKVITSFALLKRYWVQTANFEGLLFSVVAWAIAFGISFFNEPIFDKRYYILIGSGLIVTFIAVFKEAVNYKKYQMTELVVTYLAEK